VLGFGIGGLVVLALFVLRESRAPEPMLPLDIFRSRSVSAGTTLVVIGFIGLFGVLFFITLYLQNVHGYTPVQTGVKMLPLTAMFIVSPIIGSVLTDKLGPRPPAVLGMLALGAAFFGLTGLGTNSPYGSLWPWFLLIGFALGLIITSTTQAIVGNVAVERGGIAGGLQTTANQLGGVLGTSVLGSILVLLHARAARGDDRGRRPRDRRRPRRPARPTRDDRGRSRLRRNLTNSPLRPERTSETVSDLKGCGSALASEEDQAVDDERDGQGKPEAAEGPVACCRDRALLAAHLV